MITTRGYAAMEASAALKTYSFERRDPKACDVVIDIQFCGVCHSDIHQVRNEWGGAVFPMVPGHEIVGIVSRIGSSVTRYKVGDRVGVGCFVDSCRQCECCRKGYEQFCDKGMVQTYNSQYYDGERTMGGYSKVIVVDENYVLRIPNALPMNASAPLLCAGITLYSPLKHWQAGPGKRVGIIGLGGLGHMGVKIGHAMGAEVTVLSQTLKKQSDGKRLGADHFLATSDPNTFKSRKNYFDLMINTVAANIDINSYLDLLRMDGTLVLVGVPPAPMTVGTFPLIFGRHRLAGSGIGGMEETQEMLDFCGKHSITSDIELIKIQQINEAYERVVKSDVRYRFVIDMASL